MPPGPRAACCAIAIPMSASRWRFEGGLFTPMIRHAELKTLGEISNEMKDLAERARKRRLAPHEYQGGTTSISNLGMFGIKSFDAVINPPHATILAVGAGEKRPVVDGRRAAGRDHHDDDAFLRSSGGRWRGRRGAAQCLQGADRGPRADAGLIRPQVDFRHEMDCATHPLVRQPVVWAGINHCFSHLQRPKLDDNVVV